MNEFLKKEWEDTELPESERLRIRNRAWSRFHSPPTNRPKWRWVVASVPLAGALLWALVPTSPPKVGFVATPAPFPLQTAEVKAPPARPPVRAELSDTAPARAESGGRSVAPRRTAKKSRSAEASLTNQEPPPSRLVLNFRLPESGVRMIWVQDPEFYQNQGELK